MPTPTVQEFSTKKRKAASKQRSEFATRDRWVKNAQSRADLWFKITPSFILPNASLEELEKNPSNRPADVADSKMMMEAMESQEADACSGRWYDSSGRLMVAVFADHFHLLPVSSAHDLQSPDLTDRSKRELRLKPALLKTTRRPRKTRSCQCTQLRAERNWTSSKPKSEVVFLLSALGFL